jgi:hypothetical protein
MDQGVRSNEQEKTMKNEIHELNVDELDAVSGGFRWQPGTKNPDVIDARGGQTKLPGLTFTRDINGNISSITY